jgi:ketosteroid isomerase-like protein
MLRPFRVFALFLLLAFLCVTISARESAVRQAAEKPSSEGDIRALLEMQTAAWNRGDVDSFMEGYWKSDETVFVGANGLVRGWQAVLERYRRNYPDRKAMGRLTFSHLEIHSVCPEAAFVIGQYQLERESDHPAGIFTLNFRKFPEGWKIVADHTTAFAATAPAKSQ